MVGSLCGLVRRLPGVGRKLFGEAVDIKRKEDRYGTVGDAREAQFGGRIELGEHLDRCIQRPLSEARRRSIPIDPSNRYARTLHLLRWRGTGDEQSEANKNDASQSGFPRSAARHGSQTSWGAQLKASNSGIQGSCPGRGAWPHRKILEAHETMTVREANLTAASSADREPEIIESTARLHLTLVTTAI